MKDIARYILCVIVLLTTATEVLAATLYAVSNGNWNGNIWSRTQDGSTVRNLRPGSGDDVVINSQVEVTLNASPTVRDFTSYGRLNMTKSQTLTVNGNMIASGVMFITGANAYLNIIGNLTVTNWFEGKSNNSGIRITVGGDVYNNYAMKFDQNSFEMTVEGDFYNNGYGDANKRSIWMSDGTDRGGSRTLIVKGDFHNKQQILFKRDNNDKISVGGKLIFYKESSVNMGASSNSFHVQGDVVLAPCGSGRKDCIWGNGVFVFDGGKVQTITSTCPNQDNLKDSNGNPYTMATFPMMEVTAGTTVNVGSDANRVILDSYYGGGSQGQLKNSGTVNISGIWYMGGSVHNGTTGVINVPNAPSYFMQQATDGYNDGEMFLKEYDNLWWGDKTLYNNGTITVSGDASFWKKTDGNGGRFVIGGDLRLSDAVAAGSFTFEMNGTRKQELIADTYNGLTSGGFANWTGQQSISVGLTGLKINNSSAEGVHAKNDIVASYRVDMQQGVLHLESGKKIWLKGSQLTANTGSWVDGLFRRTVGNTDEQFFPVGTPTVQGWMTLKSTKNSIWTVQYNDEKCPAYGTDDLNKLIYSFLQEKYWSIYSDNGSRIAKPTALQHEGYENINTEVTVYFYDNTQWNEVNSYVSAYKYGNATMVPTSDAYEIKGSEANPYYMTFGVRLEHKDDVVALGAGKAVWTGSAWDQKWDNRYNWLSLTVPTENDNVEIKSSYSYGVLDKNGQQYEIKSGVCPGNYPLINGSASTLNLTMQTTNESSPASLTVETGSLNVNSHLYINAAVGSSTTVFENHGTTVVSGSIQNNSIVNNYSTMTVNAGMLNNATVLNDGTMTLSNSDVINSSGAEFISNSSTSQTILNSKLINNGSFNVVNGKTTVKGGIYNIGSLLYSKSLLIAGDARLDVFTNGEIGCNNLEINNTSASVDDGVYLTGDAAGFLGVANSLTLTAGVLHIPDESEYLLLNGSTLNATNCGVTCYVDGLMYRKLAEINAANPQYLFPVGNGGRYAYAKLSPDVANAVLGVRYYNAIPTPEKADLNLYRSLDGEYWTVKAFNASATNAYVKFHYDSNSNIYSYSDNFVLAEYNGASWTSLTANIDKTSQEVWYTNKVTPGVSGHKYSFGYSTPTLTWTGSVDNKWSESGNWMGGKIPGASDKAVVSVSPYGNYPVVGSTDIIDVSSLIVNGNSTSITVNGGSLIISGALTVDDNTNAGHVIINQDWQQSSNLVFGSSNYNGKITVNRTFYANILNYIGSATVEGTLTGMASGDYLAMYDYNTEKFGSAVTAFQKMNDEPFRGATLGLKGATGGNKTIQQVGTIASGAVSFSIPRITDDWYGWHMISNPYQAALNVSQCATFDHVEPIMWIRSFDKANSKYLWYTCAAQDGVTVGGYNGQTTVGDNKKDFDGTALAPNQAFYVRVTSPYATPNVTFKDPAANPSVVYAAGTTLKAAKIVNDVLRLAVESEGMLGDDMAMLFRDGGSLESISRDAQKRFDGNSYNQIYALKESVAKAIAVYPLADEVGDELMPIGVQLANGAAEGVIKAINLGEFDNDIDVYLYDFESEDGEPVSLRDVDGYYFTAATGTKINNRFAIALKSLKAVEGGESAEEGSATAVADITRGAIMIGQDDNKDAVVSVSADLLGGNGEVNVYDLAGRLVKKQNIREVKTTIDLGNQSGVYVVEAICGDKSQKAKLRIF